MTASTQILAIQIILEISDRLPEALDRAVGELTPTETIPYQDD